MQILLRLDLMTHTLLTIWVQSYSQLLDFLLYKVLQRFQKS